MIEWIAANAQALNTIFSGILMIVWVVYLNLILTGIRRTRRPMLMISRGAGSGAQARLFISNMGAEPAYITALIADVESREGKKVTATITQNDELSADDLSDPGAATNEGPLDSGAYMDSGSFGGLLTRISMNASEPVEAEAIDRVTLTVVAATGHSATIAAGRKTYRIKRDDDGMLFHPEHLSTTQLRSVWARRRIHRRLNRDLQAEL